MAVFAYLVGCEKTKAALVIDPAGDEDRILREANKRGFKIEYIVNTSACTIWCGMIPIPCSSMLRGVTTYTLCLWHSTIAASGCRMAYHILSL